MVQRLRSAKLITLLNILVLIAFIVTAFFSTLFINNDVLAHSDATPSATRDEVKERVHDRLGQLKEKFEVRLDERKQKICERVEARIKRRSTRLTTRVERITDRFDTIADRVKSYYNKELVPTGATIDNYDALVADIATKGAAVNEAVANAKASIGEFDCTGDSPKGVLTLFKDDMKTVIVVLKNHRQAVVNLIVAVRTKGKNIKSPTATSSANQ